MSGLEEQIKIKDILVRLHKEQESGTLEDNEESELVAGFSYSRAQAFACDEISIEDLTDTELEALHNSFQMPMTIGGGILEAWMPWWESKEIKEIVISKSGDSMVENIGSNLPDDVYIPRPLHFPLTEFSKLTSKDPSNNLILYLIDMLFWYCLELRVSNGDYESADQELLHLLFFCSKSFNQDDHEILDSSVRELALSIIEKCCKEAKTINKNISRGIAIGVLKDVSKILGLSREGILLALSDLYHISARVKSGYQSTQKPGEEKQGNLKRKKISLMEKKLIYFLSWANEYADIIAPLFSQELESVYMEFKAYLVGRDDIILPVMK